MNFEALHRRTLARMKRDGSPVRFEHSGNDSYSPATDEWGADNASGVDGYATEVPAEPQEFVGVETTISSPVTLLFVPVTFAATPVLGDVCTWAGSARTIRALRPIRPAQEVVAVRVLLE